jgi:hypothetical protein
MKSEQAWQNNGQTGEAKMIFTPQTHAPETIEAWLNKVFAQTMAAQVEHLYLLADLATPEYPILNTLQFHSAQLPFILLLEENHGREFAESGPALIQIDMANAAQKELLLDLLSVCASQPCFMLLIPAPHISFQQLAATLYRATQVEQGLAGEMRFILRYYDPRCFVTALNNLAVSAQKLLIEPVRQWHWLNRDACPCQLEQPDDIANWPDWPHPALHLSEQAISHLCAWHQAEQWRQQYHLTPADLNQANQETLMQLLVSAQLAADHADLLSEPERVVFIREYLSVHAHD